MTCGRGRNVDKTDTRTQHEGQKLLGLLKGIYEMEARRLCAMKVLGLNPTKGLSLFPSQLARQRH